MIRPLIESIYDYRMVFAQESSSAARNAYKQHYLEACGFVAAQQTLNALSKPNATLEKVIEDWNNKNSQINKEKKDPSKADYKTKLDELFKNAGKSYYKSRDYQRSREKSSQRKESRFSNQNHHQHSRRLYIPNLHNQKYEFPHKSQSSSTPKYRNDRY